MGALGGGIPRAIHRGADELPWVDIGEGSLMRVLHTDVETGLWVVHNRFRPGYRVATHKHTGEVYAFTIAGAWRYEEYPEVNRAGSYLYEPAGSVHTLFVPDEGPAPDGTEVITEVWFAVTGANLNLDADGNVESVYDAAYIRDSYLMLCEAEGKPRPDVIGV